MLSANISSRITLLFALTFLWLIAVTIGVRDSVAVPISQKGLIEKALTALDKGHWHKARELGEKSGNRLIINVIEWYYLLHNSKIAEHSRYVSFIRSNPEYPRMEKMLTRAEKALMYHDPHNDNLIGEWFAFLRSTGRKDSYMTLWGKLRHAELIGEMQERLVLKKTEQDRQPRFSKNYISRIDRGLVQHVWREGNISASEEARIYREYASMLSQDLHNKRVDNLLWKGKLSAAKRMMPYLSESYKKLVKARIALQKYKRHGISLKLDAVPKRLKNDIGLLFDRMTYRYRLKNYRGVADILLAVGDGDLPYPSKWWKYRNYAIREALQAGDYSLAEELADSHGQKERAELSEALWLKGWIALSFRNKPRKALKAFEELYRTVSYPISKARGAYWAGLAARYLHDGVKSQEWFIKAAEYNTTFYGQLAYNEMYGSAPLNLPRRAVPSKEQVNEFVRGNALARTVILLNNIDMKIADRIIATFVKHLIAQSQTEEEAGIVAHICNMMRRSDMALIASKEAVKKGFYLIREGYPTVKIPRSTAVEPELAYAIIRQESLFSRTAKSRVGATGMMQLMPSTARLTAKKHNIRYKKSYLLHPKYNIMLGSLYLRELLDIFDGSHVKAIAGYNAGPARPSKWSKIFPIRDDDNLHEKLNWIEMIPFSETRNYVMRVLENYQIYRHLLSNGEKGTNAIDMVLE